MNGKIKSIQDKLKNYSRNHNRIHQFTLTRYFQERLLYRLSQSDFKDTFLLKGGALMYALQKEESRPTLDLDFLGIGIKAEHEEIKGAFQAICGLSYLDGVRFELEQITIAEIIKEGNYGGIRVKIPARLGKIKQVMQIDIGFGDVVTPGPIEMEYPTIIDMESPKLFAYSVESLISEKFQAMIDLSEYNSRMKDFHDVYTILIEDKYDEVNLRKAVENTFKKRNTKPISDHSLFDDKFFQNENRIKQWEAYLKKINLDTELAFSEVMKTIKDILEPIYNQLK